MAYQLSPGTASLFLPGVGTVTSGQILTGDYAKFVSLGLLVEVPAAPAAATQEPSRAPVRTSVPVLMPERVLVEPVEESASQVLVDTSASSQVEAVQVLTSTPEKSPFEDLPPAPASKQNRTPPKNRR